MSEFRVLSSNHNNENGANGEDVAAMLNNSHDPVPSGFSFDNVHRNAMLEQMMAAQTQAAAQQHHLQQHGGGPPVHTFTSVPKPLPQATKTGTTIAGLVYRDGVVLGADTRATNGDQVAEKNCIKIHKLADNIYCCGAGTAADCDKTTDMMSSQLELLRMNTKSESRLVTACTLLKRRLFAYQGHIGAALVLGGCDVKGPHVYQIYPHGSTAKLPYTTMGSGSLAAMAVMETEWREDMTEEEAVALMKRCILAGVWNDLGSGSNCDTCVIRKDRSVVYTRGAVTPNDPAPLRAAVNRSEKLIMKKGTTPVLSTRFTPAVKGGLTLADVTVTPMET